MLICLATNQHVYDATDEHRLDVKDALRKCFWNLEERFDVRVLGGMDDDLLSHGPSRLPRHRAYILLEARDFDTVVRLCELVKDTRVGDHRLWRYIAIEARIGRPLPFVEV